jgi:adenylyltransferase/sulfurtransferase
VREPFEYEIARIEGSRLIPLGELEGRISELPKTGALVLQCHSGGRSEHAARLLREAGFENAVNLEGGIDAWSVEIDPAIARY